MSDLDIRLATSFLVKNRLPTFKFSLSIGYGGLSALILKGKAKQAAVAVILFINVLLFILFHHAITLKNTYLATFTTPAIVAVDFTRHLPT